jgi:hypothetical protein
MSNRRDDRQEIRFGPAMDKRIIEGFLDDRQTTLEEFEQAGFDRAAILKRAKKLFHRGALQQYQFNPPRLSVRKCLECQREFLSYGPQHRHCEHCRRQIESKL